MRMVKLLVKHKANARAKTYDEITPAFLTKDPDILAVSFQWTPFRQLCIHLGVLLKGQ